MRQKTSKTRSINALLIAGILHLWLALCLTFFYYTQLSNEIDDVFGLELVDMENLDQMHRRLKRPLPKQTLTKKPSRTFSEHRPQHLKQTTSPHPIDETLRPSEQILMHHASEIVSDTATDLTDITTHAKHLDRQSTALPKSVSSPYDITSGKGKESLRQRVKGDGKSGIHRIKSTGTADIGSIGDGFGIDGDGGKGTGKGKSDPIGDALEEIANHIIASRTLDKVNVVFVLDTSASMRDNIQQVAKNLYTMADAFDLANLEYHFGMSEFSVRREGQELKTKALRSDVGLLRRRMKEVQLSGDENALDALIETVNFIDFHADADKHLILVTDEPATTSLRTENSTQTQREKVIDETQFQEIRVNILGFPEPYQHKLAEVTGGIWQQIPGSDYNPAALPANRAGNQKLLKTFREIATSIRKSGNTPMLQIGLYFEATIEDRENPIQRIQEEFDRHGVVLNASSFKTEYHKLIVPNNEDLLIITDYSHGQLYAMQIDQDKISVYSGEYPKNWTLAPKLIANSYQQSNKWFINDQMSKQTYTFMKARETLAVFMGGQPGNTQRINTESIVDIVVMLDYSRSMGGKSQAVMLGLSTLIGRLNIFPLKYRIGLIRFAVAKDAIKSVDGVDIAQMPINEVIIENLMEDPFGGDEHLLDALVEGLPQVQFSPYAKRFLLVLTDEPTTGTQTEEKALEVCRSLGITAYIIGYPDENDFQTTLAVETGGFFYEMPKHLNKAYPNQ
ncbi:VWA domain-containing protein [Candidatus Poribacteria bacterium]|nr:VWA domain-containing protein [Candidatus Poribacteria bacterium]MYB65127.1 VWA domain-containing protein [Candidatus Poribacteria bacterium]MYI94314.1 VWA domain-containing protein [Candidatus Poribacteria bacterium]